MSRLFVPWGTACRVAVVAAFGLALTACRATAGPIPGYNAYGDQRITSPQDFGNSVGLPFAVNSPITVTALGAFDNGITANLAGADGSSGVTVAIYDQNTPTRVTPQVTVRPTKYDFTDQDDAFIKITPTTLGPGNYMLVAWNDDNGYSLVSGVDQDLNNGNGLISFQNGGYYGFGYRFPTNYVLDSYEAGSFYFTAATPVPEPSGMTLLGLGTLGLVIYSWRRRKRPVAS